jgi:hypothetical protein
MSRADHATFRLPASALFIPVLLFMITAPLASASVWTLPLFLLPLYGLFYVFWTRTVADAHSITVYLPYRRRRIQWADLDGFEFHGPRWAIAVTLDRDRIRLPMVRPRDLTRLAAVSGGRLSLGTSEIAAAENATDSSTAVIDTGTRQPAAGPENPPATGRAVEPE